MVRTLHQIKIYGTQLSIRAQSLNEVVLERRSNKFLTQLDALLESYIQGKIEDPVDRALTLHQALQAIETALIKIENEYGAWRGHAELAQYLGRPMDIKVEQAISIDSESFPQTKIYFSTAVLKEFSKDPQYGTQVLTLIMKGRVQNQGQEGVKALTDGTEGEWSLLEVKTIGKPYGEFRALMATKPGELHVFRVLGHNRINYGAYQFLHDFLIQQKANQD